MLTCLLGLGGEAFSHGVGMRVEVILNVEISPV